MPLKAMPVLEVNGQKICQSHAIERFVAGTFGLYGADKLEGARIDEIHETIIELMQSFFKLAFAKTDDERAELEKPPLEEKFPQFMEMIEKHLVSNCNGDGYLVGEKLSLADLALYNCMFIISHGPPRYKPFKDFEEGLAKFPEKLQQHFKRIEKEEEIAEWISKRPQTQF